ncbi:MAG: MarR family winged helix-turn-helix transcriptional regulator [Eggerthellaceae bacterium]|jgi:MarR family 2-MHQ and catechol resistance regulon transcriptional repressor
MAEHPEGIEAATQGDPTPKNDAATSVLALSKALGRAAGRADRKSSSLLKQYGLTPAQFSALEALYHDGPLTMRQVTEKTFSTPGNMTVVVRNLERDGLLSRTRNPADARSQLLGLTDAGRRKVAEIWPAHNAQLKELFAALSPAERQSLAALLDKIG